MAGGGLHHRGFPQGDDRGPAGASVRHHPRGRGGGVDAFPFYGNYLVALGVMLGHCFPVFYGFRGGKGILVSAGVILVLNSPSAALVFLASRMVSLGSITVAALYPILTLADGLIRQTGTVIPDTVVGILWGGMVIFMHRENIKRLLNGTESQVREEKVNKKIMPCPALPDRASYVKSLFLREEHT